MLKISKAKMKNIEDPKTFLGFNILYIHHDPKNGTWLKARQIAVNVVTK